MFFLYISGTRSIKIFKDPEVVKNQIAQATFDDGTEASVNRPYIDDLFENDIVLTLPQAKRILQEVKDGMTFKKMLVTILI
jgi:hypothetical protein